jgi:hypothetical protein
MSALLSAAGPNVKIEYNAPFPEVIQNPPHIQINHRCDFFLVKTIALKGSDDQLLETIGRLKSCIACFTEHYEKSDPKDLRLRGLLQEQIGKDQTLVKLLFPRLKEEFFKNNLPSF